MASESVPYLGHAWRTVTTLVDVDGSAAHPLPRLLAGAADPRDLSDAVHILCALHGGHPGVIDHAAAQGGPALTWLEAAADGFAVERSYLARLTAAVGPTPSTPGQAESEAAVAAQRHALDMLAQSSRSGCALGAALALALDWAAIRPVLDAAARRCGVTAPSIALPRAAETATLVETIAASPSAERALGFGAQQLLVQHRGLWNLLEARASARAG